MGKRHMSNHTKKAPTQATTPAPQMDARISNSEMIELCINSNISVDEELAPFGEGHAWLTVHQDEQTNGYGLWPDPGIMSLVGLGDNTSDVHKNLKGDGELGPYNYCESITQEQFEKFEALRQETAFWAPTNNCSSWASSTFTEVTGTDVDADDEWILGVETPRELGQNITQLNEQRALNGAQ